MTNNFIVGAENKLHGFHTRLKELHYSASSISLHKLIDEFDEELGKFDDSLMENAQALWGFIEPGDLNPELPEATDFGTALEDLRGLLVSIKRESANSMMWAGIINIVDDFFSTVNKYIYLNNIVEK